MFFWKANVCSTEGSTRAGSEYNTLQAPRFCALCWGQNESPQKAYGYQPTKHVNWCTCDLNGTQTLVNMRNATGCFVFLYPNDKGQSVTKYKLQHIVKGVETSKAMSIGHRGRELPSLSIHRWVARWPWSICLRQPDGQGQSGLMGWFNEKIRSGQGGWNGVCAISWNLNCHTRPWQWCQKKIVTREPELFRRE